MADPFDPPIHSQTARDDDALRLQQRQLQDQLDEEATQDHLRQQRTSGKGPGRGRERHHDFAESTIESTIDGGPLSPPDAAPGAMQAPRRRYLLLGGAALLSAAVLAWMTLKPSGGERPARPGTQAGQVNALDRTSLPLAAPAAKPTVPVTHPSPEPATAGATAVQDPAPQGAPSLGQMLAMQTTIATTAEDTKSILGFTKHTDELVTAMQAEISQIKELLNKLVDRPQQVAAARRYVAPAPRPAARPVTQAPTAATAPQPRTEAQLLSVDVWDGRPSVALSSTNPNDTRVRFVTEGDSNSGVTLRSADPHGQRATFDVAGRQVTLERLANN